MFALIRIRSKVKIRPFNLTFGGNEGGLLIVNLPLIHFSKNTSPNTKVTGISRCYMKMEM